MGVLLLSLGLVLVSVTRSVNLTSYGLNRKVVCRYAAEGVLHEIQFRVRHEANLNLPGWFKEAAKATDPVLAEYCPTPLNTAPLALAGADSPLVQVSIYDSAEALSKFGRVLNSDEYIVEARATLDGFSVALHQRLIYRIEAAGAVATSPSQLFSKYLLWNTSQDNKTAGDTYVYGVESDGYVHIEGDVRLIDSNTRISMPLTATGKVDYWNGSTATTVPWSKFDSNRNNKIDTTARTDRLNTSEADVQGQSGGYKSSVPQPEYTDVESRFAEAAGAQISANSALKPLWIDPANPEYGPGGSLDVGTLSHSTIKLTHDSVSGTTTARITVFGSAGSKSVNVPLPAGSPTIILTSARIASLSGTYYANLTVASTYIGTPNETTIYPGFPDFPKLPTLGTPAITIDDHLICVDQAGRPKYWVFDESTTSSYAYKGRVVRKLTASPTQLPPDGNLMPTKGSFLGRPRANLARLGPIGLLGRLLPSASRPVQSSPDKPLPAPSRLALTGVPVSDVSGTNLDTHTTNWTNGGSQFTLTSYRGWEPTQADWDAWYAYQAKYPQYYDYTIDYMVEKTGYYTYPKFSFRRNSSYGALQPSVLGIYSRGDTLVTGTNENHLGMWAFYGGDPRSRIYVDPGIRKNNRALLGSVVSPRTALSNYRVASSTDVYVDNGFRYGKLAT
jgi:hypothetical protein